MAAGNCCMNQKSNGFALLLALVFAGVVAVTVSSVFADSILLKQLVSISIPIAFQDAGVLTK